MKNFALRLQQKLTMGAYICLIIMSLTATATFFTTVSIHGIIFAFYTAFCASAIAFLGLILSLMSLIAVGDIFMLFRPRGKRKSIEASVLSFICAPAQASLRAQRKLEDEKIKAKLTLERAEKAKSLLTKAEEQTFAELKNLFECQGINPLQAVVKAHHVMDNLRKVKA